MRLTLVCFFCLVVVLCAAALAAQSKEEIIYSGDSLSKLGIAAGGWGSGSAVDISEKVFRGNRSVKITTKGLYAGGRLDFGQPVTLFTNGIDTTRYIVFTFFFPETTLIDPAALTNYSSDADPYMLPTVNKVRFMFMSDTGKSISLQVPTNQLDPDDNWVRMAVPMARFSKLGDVKEFKLKRLAIFTDIPATLYLGEMKIINDTTPIKIDLLDDQTIAAGDELYFFGSASAGVSSLIYSWDYDDSNGIQEETTGRVGRFVYKREGEYNVTLTVKDADGLKEQASVKARITVN